MAHPDDPQTAPHPPVSPAAAPSPPAGPTRSVVLRRAVRVSAAALVGFYAFQYGLGESVMALYALFTVIALGMLSEVSGAPDVRLRTFLAATGVGAVLVCLGTLLAVSTWAAAAGMLVVGFAVAYAGVGGPRVTGVVNGLQLLYVLPCFPPYQPDTLGQRLLGLLVGAVLLTTADRYLLPPPVPEPVAERIARLADHVAAFAAVLRDALRSPGSPPDALGHRRSVLEEAQRLRIANLARADRPVGPGVRDRSLLTTAAATRAAADRVVALADLLTGPAATPHPRTADLVGASAEVLDGLARTLRAGPQAGGRGVPVDTSRLTAALAAYSAARGPGPVPTLRAGLAAVALAEDVRLAALAVTGFSGAPRPAPAETPPLLWYLHAGTAQLWWRRLRAHLTPRSVAFQNAVRLALGLAVARVVAGVLDLAHGFWVLLATLSLMRTSTLADGPVLLRAFAGTLAGALLAAAVLAGVGGDTAVYAWSLPVIMVVVFTLGPLLGVAVMQAGFTLLVAVLFAQLAPADWQLAEVRLLDVLVGGVTGAVIGAAVWPRGGGGEVRRVGTAALRALAADVEAVAAVLACAPAPAEDTEARLHTMATLLDHAYAQYRTEPMRRGPAPDWLTVVLVVHRQDTYGDILRERHPVPPGPPDEPATAQARALRNAAADAASAYRAAADAVEARRVPAAGAAEACRDRFPSSETEAADLRMLDGWGWLHGLCDDLARLEKAFRPPPAGNHAGGVRGVRLPEPGSPTPWRFR